MGRSIARALSEELGVEYYDRDIVEQVTRELGITREETERFKALDSAPWLRILGFRTDALPPLSELKKHSAVPMLPKTADAADLLSGPSLALF